MLFDPVARVITKRYKLILVLWVLALLASVPFFAKAAAVTQSTTSIGGATGDSAKAQAIISSQFSSSSGGSSMFLVISSSNVTAPNVRGFVDAVSDSASSYPGLSNVTSVGSTYKSVNSTLNGAVSSMVPLENGTERLADLFYGVPELYYQVWSTAYGESFQDTQQADLAARGLLASQISNKTELETAWVYLQDFTGALTSEYQASPSEPTQALVQAAANETAAGFIQQFLAPAQQPFARQVLASFNLTSYNEPTAVESFVVAQAASLTLYTPTFLQAAYPLASTPAHANESALVSAIVVDPSAYGVPSFYLNAITGYVSPDHSTMIVIVNFKGTTASDVAALRSLVKSESATYGLQGDVAVTGDEALNSDFSASSTADLVLILPVTIIILIGASGIFFRSFVSPAVSLTSIGIALGVADSFIIWLVGTYVVGVDPNVPEILLTVLIGVGTDYSVFLLARYREERVRGREKYVAVTNSVTWAGESIATSGLTVIISFVFLGVFQSVPLLRSMGLVVGAGVLIALAGSLTLVPSIILLMPNFVFWPNVGKRFASYAEKVERSIENKTGYFSKSAGFAVKHAKLITVVSLVATVPALYVWSTAPVGYDFLQAAPKSLQSVSAFDSMSQSFGAGTIYPTYAVLQFKEPVWNGTSYDAQELNIIDGISNSTLSLSNVKAVTGPTRPDGVRVDYDSLGTGSRAALLRSSINKMISANGTFALLDINLVADPTSQTSLDTAQQLRDVYAQFVKNDSSSLSGVYLGGEAGSTLDEKNSVNTQFETVILYVMVGVGAVLLVVLGSIFLPLFAILSIVMSIAWTIATTEVVFHQLYDFPILFITPLTLFVLLLGLGMDYNVFILTRIREEATKGEPLIKAITTAIERTGGIITAAAIILAGSLGALMLSSNLLLKEFGFAFFFSILVDAMIMRTYVVPSVMSLMGKWNWYAPGRLQRVRTKDAGD